MQRFSVAPQHRPCISPRTLANPSVWTDCLAEGISLICSAYTQREDEEEVPLVNRDLKRQSREIAHLHIRQKSYECPGVF